MPLDAPAWWYPPKDKQPPAHAMVPWLLSPLSVVYGSIAGHRLNRTPTYVSSLPVICIGNFTAGGTGKTPLALDIAERLHALGARPAFLTRGYGGALSGPYDVDLSRDTAERTGDEPLLLARAAPTVIAHNRVLGAKHIERTDASVIVMDDGMQNPTLGKTLTFAVVDGARGLGNRWSIPSGPLRAPLAQQTGLPDAIILNGQDTAGAFIPPGNFSGPVFQGYLQPAVGSFELRGTSVTAFSGIGNPARFYATLEQFGARCLNRISFPDHHPFTEEDAERILSAATQDGSTIVTTEKDRVRLEGAKSGTRLADLRSRSYALPVHFAFQSDHAARLDAMLDMLVRQRPPRA